MDRCPAICEFPQCVGCGAEAACLAGHEEPFGTHTQAMMSALCIMRDTQDDPSKTKQIPDAMKLRSIYLSVKARVHTSVFRAKQDDVSLPGGKFLTTLPANPVEAPPEVIEKAFPNGLETNQAPFNVMDMANIAREISLRSTNNKVSSKIAMPTPDGFWSTFQAVCMGMMAQHLGRQNSHEECKLLLNQPRSKGLGALLDRVEDNGFQRPAVAPQLALPAPQLALPTPAVAASPSAAPPLATCHRPDRQTDRHRQTDRQRQTDRDRQRQTETDRDRQRQTETDRDRQRQTETDTDRQRQTETDRDRQTDEKKERQKERTTDRQQERIQARKKDRKKDSQRETDGEKATETKGEREEREGKRGRHTSRERSPTPAYEKESAEGEVPQAGHGHRGASRPWPDRADRPVRRPPPTHPVSPSGRVFYSVSCVCVRYKNQCVLQNAY